MPTTERIDAAALASEREGLVDLLIDAVEHGSSVGFVLPLGRDEAGAYWDGLAPSIASGSRLLWVARADGASVGTVQLELVMKKNGINRAEVQKLLVHTRSRRSGVARALMATVEARARELGRGLLYLDTEAGSGAEALYRALGYTCIGGLPEYACSPGGEWRANAIYYKTLFLRNNA
ncbi:MAG TPA: GNAT family N-acetyltransferase [Burkholderiaceae bacterium]|nr:GNAT family N-acetyltransferase [Burkholderiaceae bacterium]